ncbi:MAG: serine/threonine protein kinase [Cyanobacteria bacterium J06621_11]
MLINHRYQVIRPLGEGGFGHAYLAEDTQMPSRRKCVIKQLKPITTSPEVYQVVQDRFQREAAILEQLGENHRQIPRLHAYFSENQKFYLVQEWIEGDTLEEIAIPQPESAVVSILTSLLPVLDFIHTQGIIHRDLKPENIILRSGSHQPVLIDFGAVRETMGTVMNSQNHPTSSIVIGTPGYMSAEQAIGRPIPSSDLYSLGLTAIFLLTGQVPQALTTDIETGEIVWQPSAQHVSEALRAVLDQAVRSHPRDRYPSATDMLSALLSMTGDRSISTPVDAVSPAAPTVITPVPATPIAETPPAKTPNSSQLKTMAVAPAAQALHQSAAHQSAHQPNNQTAANTVVSSGTQRDGGRAAASQSAKKTKTPLIIGLTAAILTSGVVIAGLMVNRDHETLQPLVSDTTVQSDLASSQADTDTTENTLESSPDESPNEPDLILVPSPQPINEINGSWVTLAGRSSQQVDIFEQPSFAAGAPHYGVGGDRVLTVGEQYQQPDGPVWMRIQFQESGVAGWVPEFQIDQNAQLPETAPPETAPSEPFPEPPPNAGAPSLEPSLENAPKYTQLKGPSSDRINIRSAPSTSASSPHYAVGGDAIQILDVALGADGYDWYEVAFESGAEGWVRSDLVELP